MITHLFFDAGNTLVFVNMESVSRTLGRNGERVSAAELWTAEHRVRRVIDDPELVRQSDDQTRWTLYFTEIFRACGVARPETTRRVLSELAAYHARSNLWEVVPPEVPPVLERLRQRYRLAVISNANGTVREKLRRVGLTAYFELVIDSHEEKIEKPDPRIFQRAMERMGAKPEQSLHVGDFYHIDIVGARAAGMDAVLLDPGGVHPDKPVVRIESIAGLLSRIDVPSGPPV